MAVTASCAWLPMIANLMIAFLDRRPSDAEGNFLLARVAAIFVIRIVKRRPEYILRMRGQVVAHGRRQIFVARVRHYAQALLIVQIPISFSLLSFHECKQSSVQGRFTGEIWPSATYLRENAVRSTGYNAPTCEGLEKTTHGIGFRSARL